MLSIDGSCADVHRTVVFDPEVLFAIVVAEQWEIGEEQVALNLSFLGLEWIFVSYEIWLARFWPTVLYPHPQSWAMM